MTAAIATASIAAPPFNADDAERAYRQWGCNCGPSALAAMLGLSLDAVRPLIPGFEAKGYTTPAMMSQALRASGKEWRSIGISSQARAGCAGLPVPWPYWGLVRIQWEGPWTAPGVPFKVRYRYSHWIGTALCSDSRGIFDINAMANGTGWIGLADWQAIIVPMILTDYPRANGRWHKTHAIELRPPHRVKERAIAP